MLIMINNWIKLNRDIQNHWIYKEKRKFSKYEAWIDLIMMANHEEHKFIFGGELIKVRRGEIITSEIKLMEKFRWSKSKLRLFLELLEKDEMIEKKTTSKRTSVFIKNYNKFQDKSTEERPLTDHRQTDDRLQKDTNKNDKNVKNEKKYILSPVGDEEPKQFNFQDKIKTMFEDKDDRMKIIAYYWTIKKITFPNKETYEAGIRRELRSSGLLVGYPREQIKKTIQWLKDNSDFKWTLETVHKYIDEPLENFKTGGKPKTEEDLISEIQKKYANTQ